MSETPITGLATSRPVADEGVAEPAGWCARVAGYRFHVHRAQQARALHAPVVQGVAHLPSWVAGLTLVDGRPVGVLDLGRFLGVSRLTEGPVLVPASTNSAEPVAWCIRVHELDPVHGLITVVDDALEPWRSAGGLTARPRPLFSVGRVAWLDHRGLRQEGDELNLRELLRHPRLLELQS